MRLGPGRSCVALLLMVVLAACSAPPDPVDVEMSVEQSPAPSGPSPSRPAEPVPSAEPLPSAGPDQRGLDGLDQRGVDGLDPRGVEGLDPRGVEGLDREQPPPFVATVSPIGSALRDRMRSSHRPGCPLGWAELRVLRLSFLGFDQEVHVGEMVIHRDHAQAVAGVFEQLYEARWPIRQMRLVDEYGGDDDRSMAANNTSGYNCRRVAGSGSWSAHAHGAAIDINPVQNPYLTGTSIAPPAGRQFAAIDRSANATVPVGVIREGDVVVRAFAGIGWTWGGDWSGSKDYQHFSAPGR